MLKRLLLIAAFLVTGMHGVQAAMAIFYSEPDETFGWAAGYGYAKAEGYAEDECRKAGGTSCRYAIECGGGWGAIALSDDSATGAALACGFGNPDTARGAALGTCMQATRAMCWTETAFDRNGDAIAAAKNDAFDMTWYGQAMLVHLGFLDSGTVVDGIMGPKTRSGVEAFQAKLGLPVDGKITLDLVWRLLNGQRGPQRLAEAFGRAYEPYMAQWGPHLKIYGTGPVAPTSYSAALVSYSRDEQLLGLATILQLVDTPCRLPALDAKPVPPDGSGGWHVVCAEGSYTLLMDEHSVTTFGGLRPIRKDGDAVIVDPLPSGDTESSAAAESSGDGSASPGDLTDPDVWSMLDEAVNGADSSSAPAGGRAGDGTSDAAGGNWSGSKH